MNRVNFKGKSVDELWALRKEIGALLTVKLESEKRLLEMRLDELSRKFELQPTQNRPRKPYPKVHAKFRNPEQPSQTWAGRGRQPRWVSEMLGAGKSMDDLRIRRNNGSSTRMIS